MQASRWASDPAEDTPKSTFTLNPAAPEYNFTPQPASTPQQIFTPQSYPEEDEFASQTRAQDDLDLFDDDFEPLQEPAPQGFIPSAPRADRGGSARGGRGRGRGRGGYQETAARPPTYSDVRLETSSTQDTEGDTTAAAAAESTEHAPATATEEPSRPRVEAVRGDRSLTGGPKKTKMSEEELSKRLALMKVKNAERTADYERAAADEASFREREVQAQEKRREEFRNRQQMNNEREKNAARKLKAMGGREWDTEKSMEEERDARRSQFRRGAYGGVVSGSRTPAEQEEEQGETSAGWTGNVPAPLQQDESSTPVELFTPEIRERDDYRGGGRGRGGRGRGGGYEGGRGGGGGRGGSRGRDAGYQGRGRDGQRGGRGSGSTNPDRFNASAEDFPALGGSATAQTTSSSSGGAWGASASASASAPAARTTTQTPKAAEKPEWDKPSSDWADEMAQPSANANVKW